MPPIGKEDYGLDKIFLIVDENISWRIKKYLKNWNLTPANELLPKERINDPTIWRYAKSNNFHILTFDEDFIDLESIYGYPPKIIWLRLGNVTTRQIAERLLKSDENIKHFILEDETGVLEIL